MNIDTQIALVNEYYGKACETAEAAMVEMARDILRKHPELTEFVIEQKMADFFNADKNWVELGSHPDFEKLMKFIEAWDAKLKLTSAPMRFTAIGPIVRKW